MPIPKLEARELMSRGYEVGATVVNGTLQRGQDGTWTVDGKPIGEWLSTFEGQEVVIIASTIQKVRGEKRTCRACGTEYEGYACPHCRQVRKRLRGRSR